MTMPIADTGSPVGRREGRGAPPLALRASSRLLAGLLGAFFAIEARAAAIGYSCTVDRHRDGDTTVCGGVALRLQGLAAAELDEPGGVDALVALSALAPPGTPLACVLNGQASGDRLVARCAVAGTDLGDRLIREAKGRRCPRFDPEGRYAGLDVEGAPPAALPGYCRVPVPRRKGRG